MLIMQTEKEAGLSEARLPTAQWLPFARTENSAHSVSEAASRNLQQT
jgi:hypothetical protein